MENLGGTVIVILIFAIMIQFCVDRVKEIMGEKVLNAIKPPVWAVIFGILFALMFNLDFFALLGFATSTPILAKLITGLIMSSGSTGVHELMAIIRNVRFKE